MDNEIRQIAFYGKGGIGKSTIASNLAAAYAEQGLNTMLIGCDPKSDCTRNLCGDVDIPTVLDVLREKGVAKLGLTELVDGKRIEVDEIVYKGYNGVLCVEAGGPEPAVGCAGIGVIIAIDLLKKLWHRHRYQRKNWRTWPNVSGRRREKNMRLEVKWK